MIIEIIGSALLSNFIAWQFSPLQELKNYLKLYNLPWYFGKLFYCHICLGLYIGWIVTGSFFLEIGRAHV